MVRQPRQASPAELVRLQIPRVLLSDASTGRLVALLDAGAVTALRTGAAAVLAAETLGRTRPRTTLSSPPRIR